MKEKETEFLRNAAQNVAIEVQKIGCLSRVLECVVNDEAENLRVYDGSIVASLLCTQINKLDRQIQRLLRVYKI